jgi:hypothetical protein
MLENEPKDDEWQQHIESDDIDLELNSFLDSELRASGDPAPPSENQNASQVNLFWSNVGFDAVTNRIRTLNKPSSAHVTNGKGAQGADPDAHSLLALDASL